MLKHHLMGSLSGVLILCGVYVYIYIPWEPTTFIFRGYNPYFGGVKHSFFMVLGSKGIWYTALEQHVLFTEIILEQKM